MQNDRSFHSKFVIRAFWHYSVIHIHIRIRVEYINIYVVS